MLIRALTTNAAFFHNRILQWLHSKLEKRPYQLCRTDQHPCYRSPRDGAEHIGPRPLSPIGQLPGKLRAAIVRGRGHEAVLMDKE